MNIFAILGRRTGLVKVADLLKLPQILEALGFQSTRSGTVIPTYENETSAINAGAAYGSPYIDGNGQLQVVKNTKQVLSFGTGSNNPDNYFCITVEQPSYAPADIFTEQIALAQVIVQGSNDSGATLNYDSTLPGFLNTLTELTLGKGFKVLTASPFTLTLIGKPIDPTLRRALPNSNVNYVGYYGAFGDTANIADVFSDILGITDSITKGTGVDYPDDFTTITKGQAVIINTNNTATQVGTTDPVEANTSFA